MHKERSATFAAAVALHLVVYSSAIPVPSRRSLQLSNEDFEDRVDNVGAPVDWDEKSVHRSVTTLESSLDGHTTYQLELTPIDDAATVYAIYGHEEVPLVVPPAFQLAAPFGADIGGMPSELWSLSPEAEWDSFLFASAPASFMSSVGISFAEWTADQGLSVTNGAVFVTDPDDAPSGLMVAAQITVRTGTDFTVQMGAQGHNKFDPEWRKANHVTAPGMRQSWNQERIVWHVGSAAARSGH